MKRTIKIRLEEWQYQWLANEATRQMRTVPSAVTMYMAAAGMPLTNGPNVTSISRANGVPQGTEYECPGCEKPFRSVGHPKACPFCKAAIRA